MDNILGRLKPSTLAEIVADVIEMKEDGDVTDELMSVAFRALIIGNRTVGPNTFNNMIKKALGERELPEFEFDVYFGVNDRVPVVHIDTPDFDENNHGPICRIYLNDEPIYENPEFKVKE